jgi:periplasmic protein TonB
MARDLFGEMTTRSVKLGSQAWYTVPFSIAAHVIIAALVIIVPLSAVDVLPIPQSLARVFVVPRVALPPAPPEPSAVPPSIVTPRSDAVLTEAASSIRPESAVPALPVSTGVVGGTGPVGTSVGIGLNIPSAPPLPAAVPPRPQEPLRPGGVIKYPAKVHHVPPVYPRLAQDARVEGLVILEAVIGVDGRVQDVKVLRSKPLLDQAAIDAVRHWRFTPTLLNGVPVPVVLTVTVNFELH